MTRAIASTLQTLGCALGLAALAPALAAAELTADEVVARAEAALGGRDAWRAIESLEITGDHTSFSRTRPFRLLRARPDLYRFDHNQGHRGITVAYDGERAWWKSEVTLVSRGDWALEMVDPHIAVTRAEAQLEPPFLGYRDKGHAVVYTAEAELDGEPYHLLDVTSSGGFEEQWYLDRSSFLPVARVTTGAYHGQPLEQRTFFDDYREVAGVWLPHVTEIEIGNDVLTTEIDQVRVNGDLDRGLFRLPLPAGMEALQELAGRFAVRVESLVMPGMPWQVSEATSTLTARQHGALLEEEIAYVAAGFHHRLRRLYTYDRFRELYRVARFGNFTSHLDVLEGAMQDGRLVSSNLATGTPWTVYGKTTHSREVLHGLGPGGFRLDLETSMDEGETWMTVEKHTYSRLE